MARAVQVLAVEQRQELRVFEVVMPGEFGEPAHGLLGRHVGQVQLLLGFTNAQVGLGHAADLAAKADFAKYGGALRNGPVAHARAGNTYLDNAGRDS